MNYRFLFLFATLVLCAGIASAKSYLVLPGYESTSEKVSHNGISFDPSQVYASLPQLLSAGVEENSEIYFSEGTYADDVTISVAGVKLLGNNAFTLTRNNNRTQGESVVTGRWTVNADNITVNGFMFTGNGQVYNNEASNTAPMSGFTFIYNKVEALTLTKNYSNGVVRLGVTYADDKANVDAAHSRYKDANVSLNEFCGDASHTSNYLTLNGLFGDSKINDNTFNDGGTPISVYNSHGNIEIVGNKFANIGVYERITAASGATDGEFCLRIYYCGYNNAPVRLNVLNNEFFGCNGQSSLYPLIRLFQGDKNHTEVVAQNYHVNLNYNVFANKNQRIIKDKSLTYNYVLYANDFGDSKITVDPRFNRYDNSEYCIGMVRTPWNSTPERYFASNTEVLDFASSRGVSFSYYTSSQSLQYKAINLPKATTVAQSFDIDDETGDVYFCQIYDGNKTITLQDNSTKTLQAVEPLVVTRCYKKSDGTMGFQYMYLDFAGHGSNMAVCRIDGVLHIVTGGNAADEKHANGDATAPTKTKSRAVCIFPFKRGSWADLRNDSFVDRVNNVTCHITRFENKYGRPWQYPAVDPVNRLFAERETKGNYVYVAIYDLDDVLTLGSDADAIKVVPIQKGGTRTDKYTGSDGNFAALDEGFQTWPAQGFTISGDYLYMMEGVGKGNSQHATYNGSAVPVIMPHVVNWRTGEFIYRKPCLRSTILNLTHGEPEGVKVHRDSKGRPHLLFGIASGDGGARKANIFDFALDTEKGLSYFRMPDQPDDSFYSYHAQGYPSGRLASMSASQESVELSTEDFAPVEATFALNSATLAGQPRFEISGPQHQYFSVTTDDSGSATMMEAPSRGSVTGNPLYADLSAAVNFPGKITVNFSPEGSEAEEHHATLRVSSPGVKDVIVSLLAHNQFTPPALVGDVNSDGKVDVNDLGTLINIICGLSVPTPTSDINGDETVDVNDLGLLINIVCGF